MIHELKTWLGFFQDVDEGTKTFEVRKDDRGFKVDDILRLREFEPFSGHYTGREVYRVVTYVMEGGQFGIEKGYCVMSLGEVEIVAQAAQERIATDDHPYPRR